MLAQQATNALSTEDTPRSCEREWLLELGIPDADAEVHTRILKQFVASGKPQRGLAAAGLTRIGNESHRAAIRKCLETNQGCPPEPCLHDGYCDYSHTKHQFICQCQKPWRGDRCQIHSSGEQQQHKLAFPEDATFQEPAVGLGKRHRRELQCWNCFNRINNLTIAKAQLELKISLTRQLNTSTLAENLRQVRERRRACRKRWLGSSADGGSENNQQPRNGERDICQHFTPLPERRRRELPDCWDCVSKISSLEKELVDKNRELESIGELHFGRLKKLDNLMNLCRKVQNCECRLRGKETENGCLN